MKRKATTLALAALIAAAFASTAAAAEAAAKQADPRVVSALDRLGLHYTVNSSGNVAVTYDEDKGRSQSVFIMSATDSYNGIEIREIWSNAGTFDAKPAPDVLVDLMTESGKNKIGSWALEETDAGKYLLFYTIKFPADASDEAYQMMLEFAASVADERELALFNSDEN
jgi:hypothetical protein